MQHLRKFSQLAFITVTLLVLAVCVSASGPGGINCKNGICVKVQLSEPIRFNEPVTVTITVETEKDEEGVRIGAEVSPQIVTFDSPHTWVVNTKAHQPVQVTTTLHFSAMEGWVDVHGDALTYSTGTHSSDYVPVRITRMGVTVNPPTPVDTGSPEPQPTAIGNTSPVPTPEPNVPPTPWNRSLPEMYYKPDQVMSFCGWNSRDGVELSRDEIKVWALTPETVPVNTPVQVELGLEGQRSLTQPLQLQVAFCPTDPSIQVEGQRQWTVTIKPEAIFTATVTVRFTALGEFAVLGGAYDPAGNRAQGAGELTRVVAE